MEDIKVIKQHNESNVRPVRILAIAAICASILLAAAGLGATSQIGPSGTSGSAIDQPMTRGDAQLTEGTVESVESGDASTSAVNVTATSGDARFTAGAEGLR